MVSALEDAHNFQSRLVQPPQRCAVDGRPLHVFTAAVSSELSTISAAGVRMLSCIRQWSAVTDGLPHDLSRIADHDMVSRVFTKRVELLTALLDFRRRCRQHVHLEVHSSSVGQVCWFAAAAGERDVVGKSHGVE